MSRRDCHDDWMPYLEDGLAAEDRTAWTAHLQACPACARRLERDRQIIDRLRRREPALAANDQRGALRARLDEVPRPVRRNWLWAAAVLAAPARLAGGWAGGLWSGSGIGVKSGPDGDERWTGIRVFSVPAGGEVFPLAPGPLPAGELAFTYTNGSPRPFSHLMILAVDQAGRIHWFYPAFLDPAGDPESIPIAAGREERELPERVRIHAAPGRLRLFALFTNQPLRVRQVEALLRDLLAQGRLWQADRLPVPDIHQHVLDFTVAP
jgi:hypothetical protein